MCVVANDASCYTSRLPPASNWDKIFSDDVGESAAKPAEAGRRGTFNGIQIIVPNVLVE